jgi:hypothetical protein
MCLDKKNYHYRRNPNADPFSVEGTETGYLLRLLIKNSVSVQYRELIVQELKLRGFSDEEIEKYSSI